MDSISRTRVALKGPLETPVGFGEKSANVTLRKLFETYANVRPVREMPGVTTPYSGRGIDLVMVRENVEDLYAGIEYMQTPGVAQCLKLISVKGCEKIARFAFEFARSEGRSSVACATKANIMKFTEGTLKRVFESVAPDYPEIESWHVIVDNCAHQLVKRPEQYDVIVTTNMNGDILSDLSSALDRRPGVRAQRQHRQRGRDLRGRARLGAEVRRQERDQPDRRDPVGRDDAAVPGAVRRGRARSSTRCFVTLESGVLTGDVVGYDRGTPTTEYTRRDHRQPGQAHRELDGPRAPSR